MSTIRKCRGCGADVPGNAPFGHCPKCLLDLGFGPLSDEVPSSAESTSSRTFGDYELLEQIGRGGMGVVYKARQLSLNRLVALKLIRAGELASPRAVQRFQIEAQAAARLDHPNIVAIYEVGLHQGQNYLSMRLVGGRSLEAQLSEGNFLMGQGGKTADKAGLRQSQKSVARLMSTVAHCVHYAHQHGVLHRDLKPGNILLDGEGNPYLTDFGLAKILEGEAGMTGTAEVMGTPGYMSPEQAAGRDLSTSTDVYSLGVILYELLAGQPPFRAKTPVETLRLVTEQEPKALRVLNASVDRDLETICLRCLEKDPARRYSSADALGQDLERWLRGEPIEARPPGPAERLTRWVRRNSVAATIMFLLFLGLTVSLLLLWRVSEERDAKRSVVRILIKSIGQSVERFTDPSQPYIYLTAEELAALTGQAPGQGPAGKRLSIGVFISQNPMETAVSYARFLPQLEEQMSARLGIGLRLDLKIYREPSFAQGEILAGKVDIMRTDPMIFVGVNQTNAGTMALLQDDAPDIPILVITRPDTAITNLAALRGRTLGLWDRQSSISLHAKARLLEAGLCQSNLQCIYMTETPPFSASRANAYAELALQGDFDKTGATVMALTNRQCDAVVCPGWQLSLMQEGRDWLAVASFSSPRSLWVGRSQLTPDLVSAFRSSMRSVRQDAYALLTGHSYLEANGVVEVDQRFSDPVRQAAQKADLFEQCTQNSGSAPAERSYRANSL